MFVSIVATFLSCKLLVNQFELETTRFQILSQTKQVGELHCDSAGDGKFEMHADGEVLSEREHLERFSPAVTSLL